MSTTTGSQPTPSTETPSKVEVGGAADDMARGLMNFFEPIFLEIDDQIKNVVSSQNGLSNQIDALQEGTMPCVTKRTNYPIFKPNHTITDIAEVFLATRTT